MTFFFAGIVVILLFSSQSSSVGSNFYSYLYSSNFLGYKIRDNLFNAFVVLLVIFGLLEATSVGIFKPSQLLIFERFKGRLRTLRSTETSPALRGILFVTSLVLTLVVVPYGRYVRNDWDGADKFHETALVAVPCGLVLALVLFFTNPRSKNWLSFFWALLSTLALILLGFITMSNSQLPNLPKHFFSSLEIASGAVCLLALPLISRTRKYLSGHSDSYIDGHFSNSLIIILGIIPCIAFLGGEPVGCLWKEGETRYTCFYGFLCNMGVICFFLVAVIFQVRSDEE